ncbi:MAG: flagellar hook-basal body complex protein [Alphaproteobacteria bacterium]|nr:flagellar hook-basal body complex protein [Alphaproteobacteria bacterium]
MSIWGAFTNSSSAMMAQSTAMGSISQNVANVNTTGYKKQDTAFHTMLSESTARFNFFGVDTSQTTRVDVGGPVVSTGMWADLSVNGRGMFVVNSEIDGSGDTLFTRSGDFREQALDANGDGASETYLVDDNGYFLMGWQVDPDGGIATPDDITSLQALRFEKAAQLEGTPTTRIAMTGNVPSEASRAEPMHLPCYDTAGNVRTLTLEWQPTDVQNQWTVTPMISDGTVANQPLTVIFGADGSFVSPDDATDVGITWSDGTTSTIALDLSGLEQLSGGMQVDSIDGDGNEAAWMMNARFDTGGVLSANYANGESLSLYQVALADFTNLNGLDEMTGNAFASTAQAGTMSLFSATSSGKAAIIPGTLEASNVDLADEFTRMITTQKAYSMNATVFKTTDEMTRAAGELK